MYDREKAVNYAREWAFSRNPAFYTFDDIGGDCTNFVSQCIYAGSEVWNYNFLTTNEGNGPYGSELPLALAQVGDVIQLSFDGISFAHTLIITKIVLFPTPRSILIASHSNDSLDRPLNTYEYQAARLIHISGVRGQPEGF